MLDRRPRVSDVAAKAGVSAATVDRVINGRGGVHERTAARVERAIRDIMGAPGAPARIRSRGRLEFVLPAQSGRSTEVLAEELAAAAARRGASIAVDFVERINAEALAARLLKCGAGGIAFQGVDHPVVRDAMKELARREVPVVTLCSDVSSSDRLGYVGMDNRAAGRTSGWLMARACRGPGKLAIVWGGQLYRSHEEREAGFRAVLRHEHSDLKIIEMIDGNDDADLNFERFSEVIARTPDLLGVYCVGGGQKGVAAALDAAGIGRSVVMIGHNFNDETKPFLLSGTIYAVIHQDMRAIARSALDVLLGSRAAVPAGVPVEIITRENMMHR